MLVSHSHKICQLIITETFVLKMWPFTNNHGFCFNCKCRQVKHHKVPRLFVGTKKWQSVRRQNGSGSVESCQENASAVNMEPDGIMKLRVED